VFTGKEGAEIDIKVATEWTKHHRHRHPGGTISQFFGQELLNKILQQPDCVGIRFYYANSHPLTGWQRFVHKCFRKSHGEPHLIITGVTKEGLDQLPCPNNNNPEAFALKATAATGSSGGSTSGTLGEQSVPCPGSPGCPQNALTGGA
ncbi:MAG: hypothetical protein JO080_11280, partial [Mucilaginibacter sp.]|nr:hypothetical protein [Mucilaginibacter sp.]